MIRKTTSKIVLILSVFVPALAIFGYYAYSSVVLRVESLEERLSLRAEMIRGQLERSQDAVRHLVNNAPLFSLFRSVENQGVDPESRRALPDVQREFNRFARDFLRARTANGAVEVVYANGSTLSRVTKTGAKIRVSKLEELASQNASKGVSTHLLDRALESKDDFRVFFSILTSDQSVWIQSAMPVTTSDGAPVGALVYSVPMTQIVDETLTRVVGAHSEEWLFDSVGDVKVSRGDIDERWIESLERYPLLEEFTSLPFFRALTEISGGIPFLTLREAIRVPGPDDATQAEWQYGFRVPWAELIGSWLWSQRIQLSVFGGLPFLAYILSMLALGWEARRNSPNLSRMGIGMNQIRRRIDQLVGAERVDESQLRIDLEQQLTRVEDLRDGLDKWATHFSSRVQQMGDLSVQRLDEDQQNWTRLEERLSEVNAIEVLDSEQRRIGESVSRMRAQLEQLKFLAINSDLEVEKLNLRGTDLGRKLEQLSDLAEASLDGMTQFFSQMDEQRDRFGRFARALKKREIQVGLEHESGRKTWSEIQGQVSSLKKEVDLFDEFQVHLGSTYQRLKEFFGAENSAVSHTREMVENFRLSRNGIRTELDEMERLSSQFLKSKAPTKVRPKRFSKSEPARPDTGPIA